MKVVVEQRKTLCKACRVMRPAQDFHWMHGAGVYCSQGCATKAQWLFLPVPRKARES